jgi:hypothetical protein
LTGVSLGRHRSFCDAESRAVVVLPFSEYERRTGPRETLLSFLQRSPLRSVDVNFERSAESVHALRDVEL